MSVHHWYALKDALTFGFEVLFMILYAVVVSLPGLGVAYLGWKLSSRWQSMTVQTLFRAGLIAVAVTPSVWGHAGILPAILLAIVLSGREKLAGVVPILVVWVVAIPVIGILAKRRGRYETGSTPG
jgi:hypothetical protein